MEKSPAEIWAELQPIARAKRLARVKARGEWLAAKTAAVRAKLLKQEHQAGALDMPVPQQPQEPQHPQQREEAQQREKNQAVGLHEERRKGAAEHEATEPSWELRVKNSREKLAAARCAKAEAKAKTDWLVKQFNCQLDESRRAENTADEHIEKCQKTLEALLVEGNGKKRAREE